MESKVYISDHKRAVVVSMREKKHIPNKDTWLRIETHDGKTEVVLLHMVDGVLCLEGRDRDGKHFMNKLS